MTESLVANTHDEKLAKRQTFGIITILLASLLFALAYYLNITTAISGDIEIRGKDYTPPVNNEQPINETAPSNSPPVTYLKHQESKKQQSQNIIEANVTNANANSQAYSLDTSHTETPSSEYDVLPIQDPSIKKTGSEQDIEGLSQLDTQLEQEAYDTEWAAVVESQTWDIFYSSDILDSEITTIDCRTTLCKIVFEHQNENALNEFKNELVRHIKHGKGNIYFSKNTQGKLNTIIYRKR